MDTKQQNPQPKRRKATPTDILLFFLGIMILFRTPWSDMNSFHRLLLFLFAFCILLRFSNLRKEKLREMEIARRKAEKATEKPEGTDNPEA